MNERKVIAAALVVIAATMVVNVFARTERSAEGQTVEGPVEPVVASGQVTVGTNQFSVFRFWSDGTVDQTQFFDGTLCDDKLRCDIVLIPGSCASDITRNGDVEFQDLLGVLNDWGPCPEKP